VDETALDFTPAVLEYNELALPLAGVKGTVASANVGVAGDAACGVCGFLTVQDAVIVTINVGVSATTLSGRCF
jgi:hypothetical protein